MKLTQGEIGKLKEMLNQEKIRKLSKFIAKKHLDKLKWNMEKYVKKQPIGWSHAMSIMNAKSLLNDFNNLDENDLGHLDNFWGRPKPNLPQHPPFDLQI